jgi:DNA modification methylase
MLLNADSLAPFPLADGSVQTCVTSPPYWGLRDYGVAGQLGLEPVPDCLGWATGQPCGACYVCHMVQVFREVRRVLRPDGTCWLNLGDSYAQDSKWGGASGGKNYTSAAGGLPRERRATGLKDKDLVGIPWRVAFALQADGWWLRSDIIWHKPNPMPESVTDRPTKAHEYIFLLTKQPKYFYDNDAVREPTIPDPRDKQWGTARTGKGFSDHEYDKERGRMQTKTQDEGWVRMSNPAGRNRRSVWTIATAPYSGAHFATFPPALVEPCILAGTSERGACPHCGAPWARQTDVTRVDTRPNNKSKFGTLATDLRSSGEGNVAFGLARRTEATVTTTGWQPTCACPAAEPRPCIVLDPFNGSGTTGMVARKHGRRFVGMDLNPTYLRELALPRAEGKQTAASIASLPLFAL